MTFREFKAIIDSTYSDAWADRPMEFENVYTMFLTRIALEVGSNGHTRVVVYLTD